MASGGGCRHGAESTRYELCMGKQHACVGLRAWCRSVIAKTARMTSLKRHCAVRHGTAGGTWHVCHTHVYVYNAHDPRVNGGYPGLERVAHTCRSYVSRTRNATHGSMAATRALSASLSPLLVSAAPRRTKLSCAHQWRRKACAQAAPGPSPPRTSHTPALTPGAGQRRGDRRAVK